MVFLVGGVALPSRRYLGISLMVASTEEGRPYLYRETEGLVDLIIEGGTLITMSREHPVLENFFLEVSRGIIRRIGRLSDYKEEEGRGIQKIDARGCIVLPGLVNSHTHAAMTLFRGIGDDLPLRVWLFDRIFPVEAEFVRPETVYLGTLLACLEMLASGTTCFFDGYFFEEEAFRAVEDAGMRAILAQGVIDFPAPGAKDPSQNLKIAEVFLERHIGASEKTSPAIFCHSPVTCSPQTLIKAYQLCERYSVPLFIHLAETAQEAEELKQRTGMEPVFYLHSLGLLSETLRAVHCVSLIRAEIELLSATGVKVVHVPESNMKLASGIADVREMIDKGLRPGLGTDGCASNNNLDMLGEMKSALLASRLGPYGRHPIDELSALCMGTSWGAGIGGLSDRIGSIEIGKSADLIVLDTTNPRMRPVTRPVSRAIRCSEAGFVRDVIVKGDVLIREGRFTRVEPMDVIKEVKALSKSIQAFLERRYR